MGFLLPDPGHQFLHGARLVTAKLEGTLDREGTGYTNLALVFIGFIVEVFVIRLGSDGGIDLFLSGDALVPPLFMELLYLVRPFLVLFARDLPLLPGLAKLFVEFLPINIGLSCLRMVF